MSVNLAHHVWEMTRPELNSTAKLRFTDKETQIELANHKYLLCRKYLAHNPRLCEEARDILLAGKANSVKCNLLAEGHLNEQPEKISEVYFSMKRRGLGWWQQNVFVIGSYWRGSKPPNTPLEVLKDIYDTVSKRDNGVYGTQRTLTGIVQHPNSTLEMAIRASTSTNDEIKQAGFARLIEIENGKEK